MTGNKMLMINHIEPIGLIAENGSDLAKVFCNLYLVQAVNEIADTKVKISYSIALKCIGVLS